jgi:hypothetical protein
MKSCFAGISLGLNVFICIFAQIRSRYSAALARIKKLRTEKTSELQQMQGEVGILEANLSHARKVISSI